MGQVRLSLVHLRRLEGDVSADALDPRAHRSSVLWHLPGRVRLSSDFASVLPPLRRHSVRHRGHARDLPYFDGLCPANVGHVRWYQVLLGRRCRSPAANLEADQLRAVRPVAVAVQHRHAEAREDAAAVLPAARFAVARGYDGELDTAAPG